jgi:hypothetical protein
VRGRVRRTQVQRGKFVIKFVGNLERTLRLLDYFIQICVLR